MLSFPFGLNTDDNFDYYIYVWERFEINEINLKRNELSRWSIGWSFRWKSYMYFCKRIHHFINSTSITILVLVIDRWGLYVVVTHLGLFIFSALLLLIFFFFKSLLNRLHRIIGKLYFSINAATSNFRSRFIFTKVLITLTCFFFDFVLIPYTWYAGAVQHNFLKEHRIAYKTLMVRSMNFLKTFPTRFVGHQSSNTVYFWRHFFACAASSETKSWQRQNK